MLSGIGQGVLTIVWKAFAIDRVSVAFSVLARVWILEGLLINRLGLARTPHEFESQADKLHYLQNSR